MKKWYGLFVLIALIVIFFLFKDLNFYDLYSYFLQMNGWYLFLAFVFCFGTFFLWAVRFKYVCRSLAKVNLFYTLKVTLAGSFVNAVTPGARIGGEPVKAHFLSEKYGKTKSKFLGAIFAERFFHLFSFAILAILSILFVLLYIQVSNQLKFILEIILISLLFIVGIAFFLMFKKFKFNWWFLVRKFYRFKFIKNNFKDAEVFEKYVRKKSKELMKVFKKLVKNKRTFFFATLLAMIYWIFFYFVSWFLFLSFGGSVSFLSVAIVVTLGFLVAEFSLTPGGVGIAEGTMILLYSVMGVDLALAIIVALISRLIYYFYSLVVGGASLVYLKVNGK